MACVALPAANPRFVRRVDDALVLVVRDTSIVELWSSAEPTTPRWSVVVDVEPGAVEILGEHAIVVGEDGEVLALALTDGQTRRLLPSVRVEPAIAVDAGRGRVALAMRDGALPMPSTHSAITQISTNDALPAARSDSQAPPHISITPSSVPPTNT